MIVDYKKKSHYSNLVTNHETEGEAAVSQLAATNNHAVSEEPPKLTQTGKMHKNVFEAQEMTVP